MSRSCQLFVFQVPFCNPMKVASSVENVWIPAVDGDKKELSNSLWLSSGSMGMKVWLTLSPQVGELVNSCYMYVRI